MKISTVSNNQNFEGKLILRNTINPQQRHLFNLHKETLEKQIKDMPFDLFIEQSKSKKTINLSTNVDGASTYFVRKNEQNFEEVANYAISDGMKKSEAYQKMVRANEILNYLKIYTSYIMCGEFKKAKEISKQIAKLGVEDFELLESISSIKIKNIPFITGMTLLLNSTKYKIYRAFTPKTEEEKQLCKMHKEYIKKMKSENIKPKPLEVNYPWR